MGKISLIEIVNEESSERNYPYSIKVKSFSEIKTRCKSL